MFRSQSSFAAVKMNRNISSLLTYTPAGLYCAQGDFYIDPQRAVKRALITHGHSDHARRGTRQYLACAQSEHILRERLGQHISLETLPYNAPTFINGIQISFHPAGHILGSAQIRLEYQGEVTVVSGDYALNSDPTCAPFESVPCHTFITEVTFGLPVYKWPPAQEVFAGINRWWSQNAQDGIISLMFAYSLGKAQRVLAGVDSSIGPIVVHEAVDRLNTCYRNSGVSLPETRVISAVKDLGQFDRALIVAPSAANITEWISPDAEVSTAFASGWMQLRKQRKNSAIDRGFVLSDHADWEGILTAIQTSRAETIWMTHGDASLLVRYLQEQGRDARIMAA